MGKALIDTFSKEQLEEIVKSSTNMAEVISKLGYTSRSGRNSDTVKKRLKMYNISIEHFIHQPLVERNTENVFCEYSTASQQTLRRWFFKQNIAKECSICGLPALWNNKELTLILDHINGDKHDNRLENLRFVCPNCNQQLETTKFRRTVQRTKTRKLCKLCGKEISPQSTLCPDCFAKTRQKVERPSREKLKALIRVQPFTTIAKLYGVTDNAVRRWCKSYELPFTVYEIKQKTNEEWNKV